MVGVPAVGHMQDKINLNTKAPQIKQTAMYAFTHDELTTETGGEIQWRIVH